MNAGSSPQNADAERGFSDTPAPDVPTPGPGNLLDAVVRQTLDSEGAVGEPAVHINRFRDVALRYPRADFALDPVVIELVRAALLGHEAFASDLREWERLTAEIAGTLFDDPQVRARLEAFWNKLSGLLT